MHPTCLGKSHVTLDSISAWKSSGKSEILSDNSCDRYLWYPWDFFSVGEIRILGKYLKPEKENHKQAPTFVASVVIFEK